MQTIRNILKISPSGAVLSDEYGSSSGVSLEFTIGTSLRLEFDLRLDQSGKSSVLPVYPLEKLLSGAYYCALDVNCSYSDSPLLLQISGITLDSDADGCTVFAVEIPNTAVEKMVAALDGKSSCRMFCEIGGVDSDTTAVFAWHFEITVLNRVFAGNGAPAVSGDPEYYTAVEVEAALSRQLMFEYSTDGSNWHSKCAAEDHFLRVRHGENGVPSAAVSLAVGSVNGVLEDVTVDAVGNSWVFSVEAGRRYILNAGGIELCVENVADSSLESEIWLPPLDSAPSVSFPATLGWLGGEPVFETGKSYIINIRNNVAVCSEYTPGVTA